MKVALRRLALERGTGNGERGHNTELLSIVVDAGGANLSGFLGDFDSVGKGYAGNDFRQELGSVQGSPATRGTLHQLEDHRQASLPRTAAFRAGRS